MYELTPIPKKARLTTDGTHLQYEITPDSSKDKTKIRGYFFTFLRAHRGVFLLRVFPGTGDPQSSNDSCQTTQKLAAEQRCDQMRLGA